MVATSVGMVSSFFDYIWIISIMRIEHFLIPIGYGFLTVHVFLIPLGHFNTMQ